MKTITGNENKLIFAFPDKEVDCLSADGGVMAGLLDRSDITIAGDNNRVTMRFDSEDSAEELLTSGGFMLIVKGNGNEISIGKVIVRCSPILGMTGMKLIVGQLPGLGAGVSRTANGCRVSIGDRVVVNGATLYLQEDNSRLTVGDDSQISWGVDIWCTDAHTITNLDRNEYVQLASGVYMQIVDRGIEGDTVRNNDEILVRFSEYNILDKYVSYSNLDAVTWLDTYRYTVTSSSIAGIFLEGAYWQYYGSSAVPAGWLVPWDYIYDKSHIKLIVPSDMGSTTAMQSVVPYYYDIHYQIY